MLEGRGCGVLLNAPRRNMSGGGKILIHTHTHKIPVIYCVSVIYNMHSCHVYFDIQYRCHCNSQPVLICVHPLPRIFFTTLCALNDICNIHLQRKSPVQFSPMKLFFISPLISLGETRSAQVLFPLVNNCSPAPTQSYFFLWSLQFLLKCPSNFWWSGKAGLQDPFSFSSIVSAFSSCFPSMPSPLVIICIIFESHGHELHPKLSSLTQFWDL